jgi:hypothetical protein
MQIKDLGLDISPRKKITSGSLRLKEKQEWRGLKEESQKKRNSSSHHSKYLSQGLQK